jgi:hypothetical protein
VRVLQAGARPADLAGCRKACRVETYGREHRRRVTLYRRLVLPLRAVTGRFKVLLFPFRQRRKLPATTWSKDGAQLTITWPDQQDTLTFHTRPDGRTTLTLHRDAPGSETRFQLDPTKETPDDAAQE